jgi:predicted amidophosphoribosyltransferase
LHPDRVTWIDETNRDVHHYLKEGDRCLFFGEYFAGKGSQGGDTNQLIHNLKIEPTVAIENPLRGAHKERAIRTVAAGVRKVVERSSAEQNTWVPIPSSKIEGHPDHDDRMLRALKLAFAGYDADIRTLLHQTESTEADHVRNERLSPEELLALLQIDQQSLASKPLKRQIVLFDDVLTTGKHFKCCETKLREIVPTDTRIMGMFVARRLRPNPFDEFPIVE